MKRVLFFAPYGAHQIHNQLDAVLGAALAVRGCTVHALLCNGLFPDCHVTIWSNNRPLDCATCAKKGQNLFGALGIPTSQMSASVTSQDRRDVEAWAANLPPESYSEAMFEGLPLGDWVTPSVHSRFRVRSHDLSAPHIQRVHRQYLIDGALSARALNRFYDEFAPTHVCMFSAWLNPYRIAFELARSRGIQTLAHERGTNMLLPGGSFRINTNCVTGLIHARMEMGRLWSGFPLSRKEVDEVEHYYTQLEQEGGGGYYNFQSDRFTVRRRLGIPLDAPVIGVFTSSEYELTTHPDYKGAPNQLEVIDEMIEIGRKRGVYIVIRHHPNIGRDLTASPEIDFIQSAYQQAFKAAPHVRVVMPNEDLTSYALLWNIDIAVSFYSTVAIEATARGIPSAMFDLCCYRDAMRTSIPCAYRDGALEKTIDSLLEQRKSFNADDLSRLYRFTHAVFFKFAKQFSTVKIHNQAEPDIRITSFEDLKPGKDPELDRVCQHVMEGTHLQHVPGAVDADRTDLAERERLPAILASHRDARMNFQRELSSIASTYSPRRDPVTVIRWTRESLGWFDKNFPVWKRRCRHSVVHEHSIILPDHDDWRSDLGRLMSELELLPAEYVVIANDSVCYDESVLPSALESMNKDGGAIQGVSFPAWLRTGDSLLGDMFTQRKPVRTFVQAVDLFRGNYDLAVLLGYGCYRRAFVAALLKRTLEECTTRHAAGTALIRALWHNDAVERRPRPLVVADVEYSRRLAVVIGLCDGSVVTPSLLSSVEEAVDAIDEAIVRLEGGEAQEALRWFGLAAPFSGSFPGFHYGAAIAWLQVGDKVQAKAHLEQLHHLEPSHHGVEQLRRLLV